MLCDYILLFFLSIYSLFISPKEKDSIYFFCQLLFVENEELLTTLAHFESCSFVVTTPLLLILLAVPAT